ncbi:hypothetical protein RZA67_08245 [Stenotrophomonas sp. C3(2023)]|uniref:hypothetical protein n=1 Tax=Stenotrophomonas sp. C3(2023) TaxID=3080277 RepID=UPI00293CE88E|nr:hypothetical protein [Stenotrophomonas sp. C3(2023)]MDV3468714.1 hypothetical protein [Stenotrophomonas sp. C3(2023)]
MTTSILSAGPRVIRMETMPLDCGECVAVIELAEAAPRPWCKALKRVLADTDGLEAAQLRVDGRFVYIIGVDPAQRGLNQRISGSLAAAAARAGAQPASRGPRARAAGWAATQVQPA